MYRFDFRLRFRFRRWFDVEGCALAGFWHAGQEPAKCLQPPRQTDAFGDQIGPRITTGGNVAVYHLQISSDRRHGLGQIDSHGAAAIGLGPHLGISLASSPFGLGRVIAQAAGGLGSYPFGEIADIMGMGLLEQPVLAHIVQDIGHDMPDLMAHGPADTGIPAGLVINEAGIGLGDHGPALFLLSDALDMGEAGRSVMRTGTGCGEFRISSNQTGYPIDRIARLVDQGQGVGVNRINGIGNLFPEAG